ncbi:MAG: DUF423 domain-containing protein [Halothiobacillaceae bacterium]|nr:DUF423 domain-containing protein [Halothiobacillaceae bacterium]HER34660.1 DUF423 domain-containing protein [Halothiobacillaceae bacterium]
MTKPASVPRPQPDRLILIVGLASGLVAVALGAMGAHGPLAPSEAVAQRQLDIATLYHLAHSLGLLVLAGWPGSAAWRRAIALCWATGIVLFSGSLYGLTLFSTPWPGMLTPFGGLLLLAGWLVWLVSLLVSTRRA